MLLIILLLLSPLSPLHLRKQPDPLDNANTDLSCLSPKNDNDNNNDISSPNSSPNSSYVPNPKFQGMAVRANETLFDKSTCNQQCLSQKKVKCECPLNINELFQRIDEIQEQVQNNYPDEAEQDKAKVLDSQEMSLSNCSTIRVEPKDINVTLSSLNISTSDQVPHKHKGKDCPDKHDTSSTPAHKLKEKEKEKEKKKKKKGPKNHLRCCCCFYDEDRDYASPPEEIEIVDEYYSLNGLDTSGTPVDPALPDSFLLKKNPPLSKPYFLNRFDHDVHVQSTFHLGNDMAWNQSSLQHSFQDRYSQTNVTFDPPNNQVEMSQALDLYHLSKYQREVNANVSQQYPAHNLDTFKVYTDLYNDTVQHSTLHI